MESVDTRLLNKRVLESLIRAGAIDGLGAHRAQMMAVIDRGMERAQKLQRARESGQHGLFGGDSAAAVARPPEMLPEVEEWPEHELLASEYSTLGFYISGHPLDKYAGRLKELNALELSSMEAAGITRTLLWRESSSSRARCAPAAAPAGPFSRCRTARA